MWIDVLLTYRRGDLKINTNQYRRLLTLRQGPLLSKKKKKSAVCQVSLTISPGAIEGHEQMSIDCITSASKTEEKTQNLTFSSFLGDQCILCSKLLIIHH